MSGFKRYDEEFKQSLVNLYQTGKTQSELCKDYGVSQTALSKWIKQYSQVKLEDNTVMTAKQIQELQKRNAKLQVIIIVAEVTHIENPFLTIRLESKMGFVVFI